MAPTAIPVEDPRALLRAARADRRIKHPHASYTASGALLCNLCEKLVKNEANWKAHLHSTAHTLRLNRAREAAAERKDTENVTESGEGEGSGAAGRKRKASGDDDAEADRNVEQAQVLVKRVKNNGAEEEKSGEPEVPAVEETATQQIPAHTQATQPQDTSAEADAEYAALMGEIDELEQNPPSKTATLATTTYPSPTSAEELAAGDAAADDDPAVDVGKSKKGKAGQDDVDEAGVALVQESEQMEGLEARLKRLKERRDVVGAERAGRVGEGYEDKAQVEGGAGQEKVALVEDEDDDDEDYEDGWGFGV